MHLEENIGVRVSVSWQSIREFRKRHTGAMGVAIGIALFAPSSWLAGLFLGNLAALLVGLLVAMLSLVTTVFGPPALTKVREIRQSGPS